MIMDGKNFLCLDCKSVHYFFLSFFLCRCFLCLDCQHLLCLDCQRLYPSLLPLNLHAVWWSRVLCACNIIYARAHAQVLSAELRTGTWR